MTLPPHTLQGAAILPQRVHAPQSQKFIIHLFIEYINKDLKQFVKHQPIFDFQNIVPRNNTLV